MKNITCILDNLAKSTRCFPEQRKSRHPKTKDYLQLNANARDFKIKEAGNFLDRCQLNTDEIHDFIYERCHDNKIVKIPQRRKNAVCQISEEEKLGMKIVLKMYFQQKRLKEFGML